MADARPDPVDPGSRLEIERADARRRLASLTGDFEDVVAASYDDNADDEHDPEGATIAFERSQIGAMIRQVERHLLEIDAALLRVQAGQYGVCEHCTSFISDERLAARPVARTCVACVGG